MKYRLTADATFTAESLNDALGWLSDYFDELSVVPDSDNTQKDDVVQQYNFVGPIKLEPAE